MKRIESPWMWGTPQLLEFLISVFDQLIQKIYRNKRDVYLVALARQRMYEIWQKELHIKDKRKYEKIWNVLGSGVVRGHDFVELNEIVDPDILECLKMYGFQPIQEEKNILKVIL